MQLLLHKTLASICHVFSLCVVELCSPSVLTLQEETSCSQGTGPDLWLASIRRNRLKQGIIYKLMCKV